MALLAASTSRRGSWASRTTVPVAPRTREAMSALRLVQNRMPTRSSASPFTTTRVRASFSISTPCEASAAGMSRSSS